MPDAVTVKFIGGPLNGEVRELENTRPLNVIRLSGSHIISDETKPYLNADFEEIQYWLVPKRDGTWMAFEKPVWDEVQGILREGEARERRLRQQVHDALDRMLGW